MSNSLVTERGHSRNGWHPQETGSVYYISVIVRSPSSVEKMK